MVLTLGRGDKAGRAKGASGGIRGDGARSLVGGLVFRPLEDARESESKEGFPSAGTGGLKFRLSSSRLTSRAAAAFKARSSSFGSTVGAGIRRCWKRSPE